MALARIQPSWARHVRLFSASAARFHLIGPPDPVSHLRPIIYDDAPPPPSDSRHPYSLGEFTGDTREYQWKMQRSELDAYNHAYWTDSNTRFEAAKQAILDSLPESAAAIDQERALSAFYRGWVMQESERQAEYNAAWEKLNWTNIVLGLRVQYQKLRSRLGN